jgi:hypothetical protein
VRGPEDLAAASLGTVATSLGVFLVGALAVQISSSLNLSVGGLGVAVSVLCAAGGTTSKQPAKWIVR